jgi:flagellar M-ring protein FliF
VILDSGKTEDKDKLISLDMLQYQQKVERGLEVQAQDLLDKTMGKDKSMVRVSATLDFAKVEKTQEYYDPDDPVIRSEQVKQESTGATTTSGGVPGVQSNLQGTSSSPSTTSKTPTSNKTSRTTNYEISKTVSKIVDPVGTITKLSVSILVADKVIPGKNNQPATTVPRSPQELKSLETMVSTALGLNADRGDQINIISMPFTKQPKETFVAATTPSTLIYHYLPAVKIALIPILALLIYFFVLRPIIKTVKGEVKEHYKTVEQLERERLERREETEQEEEEEELPEIEEDIIVTMRKEIIRNPIPCAYIIKHWLSEG